MPKIDFFAKNIKKLIEKIRFLSQKNKAFVS